jgi:cell division septation protein DedD
MAVSNYDQHAEHIGPGMVYEEPSRGFRGITKILVGTIALLIVVTFGWVLWVAYGEGVRVGAVKTVPVIRADVDEIKRKPDDPGGLVVPHQDKLVFDRLAPGQSDEPVERLLPLPEVPIALKVNQSSGPPSVKAIGSAAAAPDTQVATALTPSLVGPIPVKKLPVEDAAPPPETAVAPPPPPAPPVDPAKIIAKTPPAAAAPLKLPTDLAEKAPAVPAAQTPPPPPAVEKSPQIAATAAWRIQLVSLRSLTDAEAVWTRLQKANNDLLGGLELQVQTAKLSKGTFYRVQAGPLSNRAAAASLCGTLKSRKQDCLVVAPKR